MIARWPTSSSCTAPPRPPPVSPGSATPCAERGHRPLTVDVPGGTGAGSVGYADLLAAQLPDDLDRPVVAAHSAAGLLLPALADRLDAAHQVWMAAVVPDFAGGRSFLRRAARRPGRRGRPGLDRGRPRPPTPSRLPTSCSTTPTPPPVREALTTLALCDLSAVYAEDPPLDPAARPSTYLLPTGDRTLRPSWMRRGGPRAPRRGTGRAARRAQPLRRPRGGGQPEAIAGSTGHRTPLDRAPPRQRPAQRQLVGELQVAAHRQAATPAG